MTVLVTERVVVMAKALQGVKDHSERERVKGGYEAVGFLARVRGTQVVTTVVPLVNHCANPTEAFFVEPWEQYRAETKLDEAGYEIVGVYHSHPTSEAIPSGADRAIARPGELMVIYSVAFDELAAWREQDGQLLDVELVPA